LRLTLNKMATTDAQRHKMIRRAVLQRPEAVVEVTIELWERLAAELVLIIGEGGFQSLYARSIHLTCAPFPWIEQDSLSPQVDSRFSGLKLCLEARTSAETIEASTHLLATFIKILAELIGEPLTDSILRSAWGDDAMYLAAKEIKNE
jgi:hypothetical protein